MSRIYFEEEQHFNQPWLWALLGLVTLASSGMFIYASFMQIVMNQPWGNKSMPDATLVLFCIFFLVANVSILLFFAKAHLDTRVDKYGLYFRFFPLIRNWRQILPEDLEHHEVKKYRFRGYGIRWGITGVRTYNVRGNMGAHLLVRGKNIILGTQRPEELQAALDQMKKRKEEI
jgi:Family of unknown function (DUF6141)